MTAFSQSGAGFSTMFGERPMSVGGSVKSGVVDDPDGFVQTPHAGSPANIPA